jgi:hypothetical protein
MKNGQKLKLGDAHVTPRNIQEVQASKLGDAHVTPSNIQEVQASKLGDAQGTPFFINKISGHLSRHCIFIASYAMCCS